MAEKQYVCAYKYCLHCNEKVSAFDSVVIAGRQYHVDCADMKRKIMNCVGLYVSYTNDKTQYPIVTKIINTLVHKNRVPIEYIRNRIKYSQKYYTGKPVYVLYGLRRLYWTKEFNTGGH